MKISKNELRRLIAEELQATLQEQMPLTSFEGAGGYSYTERDDGGFDFMDSAGRTGTAAAGSAAARSIAAERDTGTSLYKAPAQPAIPELDAVSDYIPELDMVSMTEPSDAPGYGTAGTGFTAFQGRGRRGQARKAMKAMGATGAEARGAVRGAAKAARQRAKAQGDTRQDRRDIRRTLLVPDAMMQEGININTLVDAVIAELSK